MAEKATHFVRMWDATSVCSFNKLCCNTTHYTRTALGDMPGYFHLQQTSVSFSTISIWQVRLSASGGDPHHAGHISTDVAISPDYHQSLTECLPKWRYSFRSYFSQVVFFCVQISWASTFARTSTELTWAERWLLDVLLFSGTLQLRYKVPLLLWFITPI